MRGVDVSEEDIRNAEEFLRVSGNYPPASRFVCERDGFIRLLAWYGRLRRDGDGRGKFVNTSAEASAADHPKDRA